MKKRKSFLIIVYVLCIVLGASAFSGCSKSKKDSIVIMTEDLSRLFNPFYATTGADQTVVGMTQIGMLTTDSEGEAVAGDDQPTAVKAFDQKVVNNSGVTETVYTFVLKNNLKFSDGKPLTINDVFFNLYEYLDPVYTGSSTMYSIKIKGLTQYRTQEDRSGEDVEAGIYNTASTNATLRINELVNLFEDNGRLAPGSNSFKMTEAAVRAAIATHEVSLGYKNAVAPESQWASMTQDDFRAFLLADYELTLKTFREELESDYRAAKESFDVTTVPYKEHAKKFESDIFKFFLYEGYITPEYADNQGKPDKTKIVKFNNEDIVKNYTTEKAAIDRVYKDKVEEELNTILKFWGTAGTLATQYTAAAIDVILRGNLGEDGGMQFPNIEGIVSLGHTTDVSEVTIGGTKYKVAKQRTNQGVPVNKDEYDVLQITVEGTDPKAIYNFGFSVAPAHYYTADSSHPNGREIDIANNKFGVEWASADFQSKVIQSPQHVEVPVGAGPYMATDADNSNSPSGSNFVRNNIVYFKANDNFMFPVKTEKLRMQVISPSNALDSLESGAVDFVYPQFTRANSQRLTRMKSKGFEQLQSWQLGYGYIGINAGKVENIEIRRAIMAAMQPSLSLEYYQPGTSISIDWPMSTQNWAYPFLDAERTQPKTHQKTYMQWTNETSAEAKVQEHMNNAGVTAGDKSLKITFTIAGASITEHPTYAVFKQASEILNSLGWDVEVKADSQALTKLSTGSLQVWAAAWGSTIDPDMYQVYHKNSTATSVFAWGYREIKSNPTKFKTEYDIINQLSEIIDDARSYMDRDVRIPLYEEAMSLVLDLAVEMPVYQRMNLYAYNSKAIKGINNKINPYTSPLERIWELELVK